MMLTEEEAREKSCCGSPAIVAGLLAGAALQAAAAGAEVTMSGKDRLGKCVASECMAWRSMITNVNTTYSPEYKRGGYCGLAGKPSE